MNPALLLALLAPASASTGGPDTYGYTWIDSNEIAGPAYAFDDISATGTRLSSVSTIDDTDEILPISWSFPFYGVNRTTFNVTSNGAMSFETLVPSLTNYTIPSSSPSASSFVAFIWDDMDPGDGGDVYYQLKGTPGIDERLIVQYENVEKFSGYDTVTCQVVLWESGLIQMAYESMSLTGSEATIGIQGTDYDGLEYSYNTSSLSPGLMIEFTPPNLVDNDLDDDGYDSVASGGTDCDDTDSGIHPGAYDIPGDAIDQDCDGSDAVVTTGTDTGDSGGGSGSGSGSGGTGSGGTGSGGSGSGGAGTGTGSATGGTATGTAVTPPEYSKLGCGCASGGSGSVPAGIWLGFALLGLRRRS